MQLDKITIIKDGHSTAGFPAPIRPPPIKLLPPCQCVVMGAFYLPVDHHGLAVEDMQS